MEMGNRNIEFLYEIGALRYIPRSWRQFLNKNFANQSEHMFRVAWIAMIIAQKENADINKVIKMALIHDVGESRNTDTNYLTKMYTTRDDDKALQDILQGVAIEHEFLTLFQEYKERKTLEARIVKDADQLDVDFELQEQYANGVKVKEDFQTYREKVFEQLFTATAKDMWTSLKESNPHDWHVKGKNIFTSEQSEGDSASINSE